MEITREYYSFSVIFPILEECHGNVTEEINYHSQASLQVLTPPGLHVGPKMELCLSRLNQG